MDAILYLEKNRDTGILACKIYQNHQFRIPPPNSFVGCGVIIRKELIQKIGGFSTWNFLLTHEIEFSLRTLNIGYKIRYWDECTVNHRFSQKNRNNYMRKIEKIRNNLVLYNSYFSGLRKLTCSLLFCIRHFLKNMKSINGLIIFLKGINKFFKDWKKIKKKFIKKSVQQLYFRSHVLDKLLYFKSK